MTKASDFIRNLSTFQRELRAVIHSFKPGGFLVWFSLNFTVLSFVEAAWPGTGPFEAFPQRAAFGAILTGIFLLLAPSVRKEPGPSSTGS